MTQQFKLYDRLNMTQPYDGRACVHNDCAYAGYLQAELLRIGGDRIYVYKDIL